MSQVAVVGTGAIGCVYGSRLCASETVHVTLCARTPFHQMRVETPSGHLEVPVHCVTDPAQVTPVDWILLAVKGHQIADVDPWLQALVGPTTVIAVLQNGVDHIERVRPYAYGATILPTVVYCPTDRLAPGHVVQNSPAQLTLPQGETGSGLAALYAGTDIEVDLTDDIVTVMWTKLCINIAAGPITALTGQGRGAVRRPDVAAVSHALVQECAAVGRAEGAQLPDDIADTTVALIQSHPPNGTTSMLVDRRAGRKLETEVITGAVVRLGKRHGIETPLNWALNALLDATHVETTAGCIASEST